MKLLKFKKNHNLKEKLLYGFTGFKFYDVPVSKINDFISSIVALKEQIQRMYAYGKHGRYSYDFDCQTIYPLLNLKLTRSYHVFKNYGHTVWCTDDSKLMKRLKEAIVLSQRLSDDNYTMDIFEKSNKKYPCKVDGINLIYEDKETEKKARNYRKIFYKKADIQRELDKKRFFSLLEKYTDRWWD